MTVRVFVAEKRFGGRAHRSVLFAEIRFHFFHLRAFHQSENIEFARADEMCQMPFDGRIGEAAFAGDFLDGFAGFVEVETLGFGIDFDRLFLRGFGHFRQMLSGDVVFLAIGCDHGDEFGAELFQFHGTDALYLFQHGEVEWQNLHHFQQRTGSQHGVQFQVVFCGRVFAPFFQAGIQNRMRHVFRNTGRLRRGCLGGLEIEFGIGFDAQVAHRFETVLRAGKARVFYKHLLLKQFQRFLYQFFDRFAVGSDSNIPGGRQQEFAQFFLKINARFLEPRLQVRVVFRQHILREIILNLRHELFGYRKHLFQGLRLDGFQLLPGIRMQGVVVFVHEAIQLAEHPAQPREIEQFE